MLFQGERLPTFLSGSVTGPQQAQQPGTRAVDSTPVQPPAPKLKWLLAGSAISVAIFSASFAAVSSLGPAAAGVSLSVNRISVHLGSIKVAARPGNVTAALLAMRLVPVPRRGLRLSLGGIQLAVAEAWAPHSSTADRNTVEGIEVRSAALKNQLRSQTAEWTASGLQCEGFVLICVHSPGLSCFPPRAYCPYLEQSHEADDACHHINDLIKTAGCEHIL